MMQFIVSVSSVLLFEAFPEVLSRIAEPFFAHLTPEQSLLQSNNGNQSTSMRG